MNFDKELDARGLNCPLPILRAKKTLAELQRMGCDAVQGYVCARPMPARELVRWWASRPVVITASPV